MRIWARNRLYVDAKLRPDGALVIEGQDLTSGEYEYALTVAPADVPRVVEALGGGADVLALLQAHAELVVTTGERRWLLSLGIEPGFWARVGD